jgi:multisubunit Na+/H+ antiporter MnhB subunit
MNERQQREHNDWLDDRRNVDRLVYALYGVCAALFLADFFYHKHVHFAFENWIGFFGWFGFASYVFIVLSAKAWRRVVKRDEAYYERDD